MAVFSTCHGFPRKRQGRPASSLCAREELLMLLHWLRRLARRTTRPAHPSRRTPSRWLWVEALEQRWVPTGGGTPSQNFVAQAYQDLLQRPVDAMGQAFWS